MKLLLFCILGVSIASLGFAYPNYLRNHYSQFSNAELISEYNSLCSQVDSFEGKTNPFHENIDPDLQVRIEYETELGDLRERRRAALTEMLTRGITPPGYPKIELSRKSNLVYMNKYKKATIQSSIYQKEIESVEYPVVPQEDTAQTTNITPKTFITYYSGNEPFLKNCTTSACRAIFLNKKGIELAEAGRLTEAEEAFKEALSLEPGSRVVLSNLRVLADKRSMISTSLNSH